MKSKLLYLSASLILLSLSFKFDNSESESQIVWMWENNIQVPIILIGMSLVFVGMHFYLVKQKFQKKK